MTLHHDTARLIIRKAAATNGWTIQPNEEWDRDAYARADVTINARFGVRGALTFAEIHGPSISDTTGPRAKRETVTKWLTT